MTEPNDYLGSLDSNELQAEQEFLDNHWANDLLDAPHALIAVIETKIARAVIAERNQIYKEIDKHFRLFDGESILHKISEAELITLIDEANVVKQGWIDESELIKNYNEEVMK
jgi:hypothetical protein